MAVLVHNRRQTDLLVVCLLPAVVTGEVLRMMDCGKQAAKSTIPVLLVFAFLLAEWEAETNITNSATAFEKLKLVEAGQRFANSATLTGTGDSGLYWSASVMVLTLRASASTTAASVLRQRTRRVDQCCLKD
jgi:hypothetical protein